LEKLGRWDQFDLAGNVGELLLDAFTPDFLPASCQDCVYLGPTTSDARAIRGGSWEQASLLLLVSNRGAVNPVQRSAGVGGRCARDAM
jgi:formylglycine-generating enzyme required for sulfatase activity